MTSGEYKIKKLKFNFDGCNCHHASTPNSQSDDTYTILETNDEKDFNKIYKLFYCFVDGCDDGVIGEYNDIEKAIEVANGHWKERVSQYLEVAVSDTGRKVQGTECNR